MKSYVRIGAMVLLMFLLLSGGYVYFRYFVNHGMNFDFDPALVAQSERRMWEAYYTKDTTTLGIELVKMLNEQFGLTALQAANLGEGLAKTAMTFANSRDNYEQRVLPGLVTYYSGVHDLSGGDWDPKEVAQAELAWWVARRIPGQDSPENVGRLIADLYAKLYGKSNAQIERAGQLRAHAAALRDAGGLNADWERIESLLTESFTELHSGIN